MKRKVELLWQLGASDEISILFLEKTNENFEVIFKLQDRAHSIVFYIERLKQFDDQFEYVFNHLPKDAFLNSIYTKKSIADVLKENGFKVKEKQAS